jgi:hypothetical protein
MVRTGVVAAMAMLTWTGGLAAGGLGPASGGVVVIDPAVLEPVTLTPVAPTPGPTPLEWLRYVRPQEGREVVVDVGGVPVRTIEWWDPVEVRVRTESGAALTDQERAAIRAQAVTCRRGEPTGQVERTELSGTFVIEYRCARLQGFEDQ